MDGGFGQPDYGGVAVGTGLGSRLVALDGPYAGQAFPIIPGGVSIGRAPENGVALVSDSTVSRRHAHIVEEGGQHVLYDDGSSNGTFVNRVRVSVQALAQGDVAQFGSSSFRYE
jgi:predicted component of type VI protein secretion system